jgi:hypothetical protein
MSHRLQVLIPEALDARIRKEAQRLRVSKGEWVRRAIEHALRVQTQRPAGGMDPLTRLAALNGPTADIEQMIDEIESGRS